jgi:dolichyl-phosphate beta-glucosyltransferase
VTITTSIVIPAYDEAERLGAGYERLSSVWATMSVDEVEVIVVDDGSSDDTLVVAHKIYGHLPHTLFVQQPANRGKGAAVRLGVSLARGDYVIVADADMAINPIHFPQIISALHDCPVVPGSRSSDRHIRYDSRLRTIAGSAFNILVRHYIGTTLRDTQCGCKGLQRGPARLLALLGRVDGFAFDAELLFLAAQLGLEVRPVAVTWNDVHGSSVKIGRDSFTMLRDIRSLRATNYENPAVEFAPDVDVEAIDHVARQSRTQGLVLARGDRNALLVLARDGSFAGHAIATALNGTLRTTGPGELRGRSFDAV